MNTTFAQISKNRVSGLIKKTILMLLSIICFSDASKVIVNYSLSAGSDSTFISLALALNAARKADTILITSGGAHVYEFPYIEVAYKDTFCIISNQTNPDSFPVIKNTNDCYKLFQKSHITFERLTFTSSTAYRNGQDTTYKRWRQCVIKNGNASNFMIFQGKVWPEYIFENCLFVNNSGALFLFEYWENTGPKTKFQNCTFDKNDTLFKYVSGFNEYLKIQNCILSNNKVVWNVDTLKRRISNSVTTEALTNYGSNCVNVSPADPLYNLVTRTKSYDWNLLCNSKALTAGTLTTMPLTDIAGNLRSVQNWVGCWQSLQFPISNENFPRDTFAQEGKSASFTATVSGPGPFKYKWYKAGGSTVIDTLQTYNIGNVLSTLDSSKYYCIITNGCGADTSRIATLTTMKKPRITAQPAAVTAYDSTEAVFSIIASGLNLSYEWYMGNNLLIGETSSVLKIAKATKSMNGFVYQCIVKNPVGSDTSQSATLFVLDRIPSIIDQPQNSTVIDGDSAVFRITATGIDTLLYQWFMNNAKIPGAIAARYTRKATFADNGAVFACTVSNRYGGKKSVNATLTVTPLGTAKIVREPSDITTREGGSATFTVQCSGGGLTFQWYKTSLDSPITTAVDSVYTIPVVARKDSGAKFICIVKNSLGIDTSRVAKLNVIDSNQIFNPVTLQGKFISRTQVSLSISNYASLPKVSGASYVDSIGIWYQAESYPSGTSGSAIKSIKIPLSVLATATKDTLVVVPELNQIDCYNYYFVAAPIWKRAAKTDTIPPFVTTNGTSVYMCSTDPLVNPINMKMIFDSTIRNVTISLSEKTPVIRSAVRSIQIFSDGLTGLYNDTIFIANNPQYSSSMTVLYKRNLPEGEDRKIKLGMYIVGIQGNRSDTIYDSVMVTSNRPVNKMKLDKSSFGPSFVDLVWNNRGDAVDSVRIWWGLQELPSNAIVDENVFRKTTDAGNLTTKTISALSPSTKYYFGLQVKKNNVWSLFTDSSRTIVTTSEVSDSTKIPNRAIIKDSLCYFDPNTNKIKIFFTLDTAGLSQYKLEGCALAGLSTWPKNEPSADSKINEISPDSNWYELDLKEDLVFDTTYFVNVWIRNRDGLWAPPDSAYNKTIVRIPAPKKMAITYFRTADTVYAFGKNVALWRSSGWTSLTGSVTDTLIVKDSLVNAYGCIQVSLAFKFKQPDRTPLVNVGVHWNELPAKYTQKNVQIYEFDSTKNKWQLLPRTLSDTNFYVSTLIKPFEHPNWLVLMIDTLKPVVTVHSDLISPLQPMTSFTNNVTIQDNVLNVNSLFYCARGQDTLYKVSDRLSRDTSETIDLKVPLNMVTDETGLRSLLVVSDGNHSDTINLSRKVYRTASDASSFDEALWSPVFTTANLDSTRLSAALKQLSSPWKYDVTQFRIFRWSASHDTTAKEDSNWVEYRDALDSDSNFQVVPGKVFWVKNAESKLYNLGKGTTVSLKDSVRIILRKKAWNDVALPFLFNIKIGDILNATKPDSVKKFLNFAKWQKAENDPKQRYRSEYVHIPIGTYYHPEREMYNGYKNVYCIYNGHSSDVVLTIPPLPTSMSKFSVLQKRADPRSWYVTVKAKVKDGELPPVFCGYAGDGEKISFPVPPTFGSIAIGINKDESLYGAIIDNEKKNGYAYDLKVLNKKQEYENAELSVQKHNLPAGYSVSLFDPLSGEVKSVENDNKSIISLSENEHRWLLVGDEGYIGNFVRTNKIMEFKLLSYTNPVRGKLDLKFVLPSPNIKTVTLMVHDPMGRLVWNQKIQHNLIMGINRINWSPLQSSKRRLASGTYFMQLVATDLNSNTISTKQVRFMYFQ
jgi:hypothetical protein